MENKVVTLVSTDGEKFKISEKAARRSVFINGLLDDYPEDPDLPLNNIKSNTLSKIVAYLEQYANSEPREIERPLPSSNYMECVDSWDYQFIDCELEVIFDLVFAANYLDIKPLLELASSKIASLIKGKTPEEIRKMFNIVNDFTPEEENQIKEENQWCLESL